MNGLFDSLRRLLAGLVAIAQTRLELVTTELAAVTTVENPFEYPCFSICGTTVLESIAASALAEPERPPIIALISTLTCARPPRMWPTSRFTNP